MIININNIQRRVGILRWQNYVMLTLTSTAWTSGAWFAGQPLPILPTDINFVRPVHPVRPPMRTSPAQGVSQDSNTDSSQNRQILELVYTKFLAVAIQDITDTEHRAKEALARYVQAREDRLQAWNKFKPEQVRYLSRFADYCATVESLVEQLVSLLNTVKDFETDYEGPWEAFLVKYQETAEWAPEEFKTESPDQYTLPPQLSDALNEHLAQLTVYEDLSKFLGSHSWCPERRRLVCKDPSGEREILFSTHPEQYIKHIMSVMTAIDYLEESVSSTINSFYRGFTENTDNFNEYIQTTLGNLADFKKPLDAFPIDEFRYRDPEEPHRWGMMDLRRDLWDFNLRYIEHATRLAVYYDINQYRSAISNLKATNDAVKEALQDFHGVFDSLANNYGQKKEVFSLVSKLNMVCHPPSVLQTDASVKQPT